MASLNLNKPLQSYLNRKLLMYGAMAVPRMAPPVADSQYTITWSTSVIWTTDIQYLNCLKLFGTFSPPIWIIDLLHKHNSTKTFKHFFYKRLIHRPQLFVRADQASTFLSVIQTFCKTPMQPNVLAKARSGWKKPPVCPKATRTRLTVIRLLASRLQWISTLRRHTRERRLKWEARFETGIKSQFLTHSVLQWAICGPQFNYFN